MTPKDVGIIGDLHWQATKAQVERDLRHVEQMNKRLGEIEVNLSDAEALELMGAPKAPKPAPRKIGPGDVARVRSRGGATAMVMSLQRNIGDRHATELAHVEFLDGSHGLFPTSGLERVSEYVPVEKWRKAREGFEDTRGRRNAVKPARMPLRAAVPAPAPKPSCWLCDAVGGCMEHTSTLSKEDREDIMRRHSAVTA